MRTILDMCVAMDAFAQSAYYTMAQTTEDPELALFFERMSIEEAHHVTWWKELARAYDQGLVPDVVNDTEGLHAHLTKLFDEIKSAVPADFGEVSNDTKIDIAARLEFYMLDPVFGELLDLTEPGGALGHREAYARHIERLVVTIENHYSRGDLASFLARVLRRAWRDNLALAAYATRDPLTGIHNRRGFTTHLRQWLSWAERYKHPIGVLLADVDAFKRINDTHGHATGDLALTYVANAFSETARESDIVARYGGDELAVIAPESNAAELTRLAERLIERVRQIPLLGPNGEPVPLTVSIGGAVVTPSAGNADPDVLLALADRSLYDAKSAGKDRFAPIIEYSAGHAAVS